VLKIAKEMKEEGAGELKVEEVVRLMRISKEQQEKKVKTLLVTD
jgi:hypothetical protein